MNFVPKRSSGKPACRHHHRCVELAPEHWAMFDHPCNHPFLLDSVPKSYETPPSKMCGKRKIHNDKALYDEKCVGTEPLSIGSSIQVQGSSSTYTITRHADRNNQPFYWCTCPSRRFHGNCANGDNSCKHILALRLESRSSSTPMPSFHKLQDYSQQVARQQVVTQQVATHANNANFAVALASKYEPGKTNPVGMLFMEKYDGVFGHYDAKKQIMYSRQGNKLHTPQWLIQQMPNFDVTGELYGGVGNFSEFSGLFTSQDANNSKWLQAKFIIFDVVEEQWKHEYFETRMQRLKSQHCPNVEAVEITRCTSVSQLNVAFDSIVQRGGEGLMLRKNVAYKSGRTTDILKYKKIETTEGKVVGYTKGTGRFASFVGSMRLVNRDGREFKCVPPDRTNPPPIGSIVEVECLELTINGLPRHPRWKGLRTDVTW